MKKLILVLTILALSLTLTAQNFNSMHILIIDNDGGSTYINSDGDKKGYEESIIEAMRYIGFSESSNNLTVMDNIPENNAISGYSAVFIINGRDGHSPPNPSFIKNAEKYLESGGCLYIEGEDVFEKIYSEYPEFLEDYFNIVYAGDRENTIEKLKSNENTAFIHPIQFDYAGDNNHIDEILPANSNVNEPYYFEILIPSENNKIYKSTSGCHTPYLPDKSDKSYRTFYQTVNFGQLEAPAEFDVYARPDITARIEYLKEILRFFGIGRIGIKTTGNVNEHKLTNIIQKSGIDYEFKDETITGIEAILNYNVLFIAGNDSNEPTDEEIGIILEYIKRGGHIVLSGEELLEALENFGSKSGILSQYGITVRDDYHGNMLQSSDSKEYPLPDIVLGNDMHKHIDINDQFNGVILMNYEDSNPGLLISADKEIGILNFLITDCSSEEDAGEIITHTMKYTSDFDNFTPFNADISDDMKKPVDYHVLTNNISVRSGISSSKAELSDIYTGNFKVLSSDGRVIMDDYIYHSSEIDLSGIPSGTYFLHLKDIDLINPKLIMMK